MLLSGCVITEAIFIEIGNNQRHTSICKSTGPHIPHFLGGLGESTRERERKFIRIRLNTKTAYKLLKNFNFAFFHAYNNLMVKTFVCPKDAGIPQNIRDRKGDSDTQRPKVDTSNNKSYSNTFVTKSSQSSTTLNSKKGWFENKNEEASSKKARKEEVVGLMNEVKDFSSQTLKGLQKKKRKEDVLTNLGVAPVKEQTMPFKMAIGIREGRRKRDLKSIERSKDSGVVLQKGLTVKNIKEKYVSKNIKKRSREERDGLDVGTKQGVFHLKRSRIPAHLIRDK
jgi:hypothetical protein